MAVSSWRTGLSSGRRSIRRRGRGAAEVDFFGGLVPRSGLDRCGFLVGGDHMWRSRVVRGGAAHHAHSAGRQRDFSEAGPAAARAAVGGGRAIGDRRSPDRAARQLLWAALSSIQKVRSRYARGEGRACRRLLMDRNPHDKSFPGPRTSLAVAGDPPTHIHDRSPSTLEELQAVPG